MSVPHRERVLRAATHTFLAHGYHSSVDDIARRAKVAKQTVYHHFPSKDRLFRAVAGELAKGVLVELEGGDVREALLRFALAYRGRALGAQGIATFRTLVPEVPRFRALARTMYADTAGELLRRLAGYLEKHLGPADPQFAAEMLLSMLAGQDRIRRLFAVPPGAESEKHRAARIVDSFLRAFKND